MEDKEQILPNWELVDIAEMLYNFRSAMDIEGIKNTLWQLAKQQDNVSFPAGKKEVVDWLEDNKFSLVDIDNYCYFGIDNAKWQAQLQAWGI